MADLGSMAYFLQKRRGILDQQEQMKQNIGLALLKSKLENQAKQEQMMQNIKNIPLLMQTLGGQNGQAPQNIPSFAQGLRQTPIQQSFIKNPFAEDISGMVGFRTPEEMQKAQFQQNAQRWNTAQGVKEPNVGLVRQSPDVIRRALLARGVRNQLRPQFGETALKYDESGNFSTNTSAMKSDPKMFERFSEALDPTKTVRGPLGIAKIAYDKAERLESLANAFPDGNLDSRQIEELAIGFNSLLQGGAGSGGGSENIIRGLIPHTWVGNAMKIKEWLTNNPQGTQQQEFVRRMMGTVEREKATTAAQIKRVQFSRIAAFKNLEKKDPEQFNQILLSWGIEPQEYTAWKKGGYKQVNAAQAGLTNQSNNTSNLSDVQAYQEYQKTRGQ